MQLTSMFDWAKVAGVCAAYADDECLNENLREVLGALSNITERQAVRLAEIIREY